MTVTLWRCPSCPLILVGPQIAGAEQHLENHKKENDMCTICETKSDSLNIGSDGKTTACADCMGNAVDE